jgi:hypothetical protein
MYSARQLEPGASGDVAELAAETPAAVKRRVARNIILNGINLDVSKSEIEEAVDKCFI